MSVRRVAPAVGVAALLVLLSACGGSTPTGSQSPTAVDVTSQGALPPIDADSGTESAGQDVTDGEGSSENSDGGESTSPAPAVVVDGITAPADGLTAADSMALLALTPEGLTGPWLDEVPQPVPGIPGLTAPGAPAFPPAPQGAEPLEQVLYAEGILNLISNSFDYTPATTEEEVQALYDAAWLAVRQSGLSLRGVIDQAAIDSGIDPLRPGPMEFIEVRDNGQVVYCLVDLNVWSEYQLSPAQLSLRDSLLPGYRAIMGPCAEHAARWYSSP